MGNSCGELKFANGHGGLSRAPKFALAPFPSLVFWREGECINESWFDGAAGSEINSLGNSSSSSVCVRKLQKMRRDLPKSSMSDSHSIFLCSLQSSQDVSVVQPADPRIPPEITFSLDLI